MMILRYSHKISWEISETPLQLGGVSIEVCDEIQKESLYDARYPDWLAHLIWMKLHFKASVGPIGVRDCWGLWGFMMIKLYNGIIALEASLMRVFPGMASKIVDSN